MAGIFTWNYPPRKTLMNPESSPIYASIVTVSTRDRRVHLKTTQRAILAQISRSGPTTVGALAEALVMDSGALAHTLKPLERDGLVAVAVDPNDRRNRLIGLTPEGRAKLAETDALWARAQSGFEAGFGRAKSNALRKAMQFLISDEFTATFERSLAASRNRTHIGAIIKVGTVASQTVPTSR